MNRNVSPDKNQNETNLDETPLSERDFIQNGWKLSSLPFWVWIFLMAALVGVVWGSAHWYQGKILQEKQHEPFLEVTNREFSLFLWQFPSFIKTNVPKKSGYLSGFLANSENFDPMNAENFVAAPPDLIFLYHTWHRLLEPDTFLRLIKGTEFKEFLEQLPEWLPKNWKNSPTDYGKLVNSNKYIQLEDLQSLEDKELPMMVRKAFIGWKNYFKEGPAINAFQPTFAQVKDFLTFHETYGRSYWRNINEISDQHVAGLDYLKSLLNGSYELDSVFPNDQLSSFLKVALYNAEKAKNNE